jgi:hypothetical protein
MQASEALAQRWTDFIQLFTQVSDRGVSPYNVEVRRSFTLLLGILTTIEERMRQKLFIGREVLQFIGNSRRALFVQQQKVEEIVVRSDKTGAREYEKRKCMEFFRSLMLSMNNVLDRELPADIFAPLERSQLKVNVSTACSSLAQITGSVGLFHGQINEIKGKMVALNALLAQVHFSLNLPFDVVLMIEETVVEKVSDDFTF